MPYDYEFTQAARTIRTARDNLEGLSLQVGKTNLAEVLQGGAVAPLIEAGMSAAAENINGIRAQLDTLATLCDTRAQACSDFGTQLSRWQETRRQLNGLGLEHEVPPRPYPAHLWIDPR